MEPASGPGRLAAVHPLLFAAYPVLFLWSQNLGETDPREVVLPLLVLVGAAALLTLVLGRLLGDRRRAALIVSPLAIGLLMYGHVASNLSGLHVPAIVQQLGWMALVGLGIVAAVRLPSRRLATIDLALDRVSAILVIVSLVLILPYQATTLAGGTANAAVTPAPGTPVASHRPAFTRQPQPDTTTAPKRDVYWLIFDRYGSDRAYDLLYGIDNDLTPWLRDQGFTVLDDSHANYVRTGTSIPTTINMTHLRDVPGLPGPDSTNLGPIQALIKDSLVARQFKALGYRYYHVGSRWDPNAVDPAADVDLYLPAPSGFVTALLDASALPAAARRLRLDFFGPRERQYRHNAYSLDALAGLRDEPGPKFVFGHVLLPHPPMVFDRDGRYMSGLELIGMSGKEQLERQLAYTNTRIREIVGALVALPGDRRPIIILQADEGPESPRFRSTRNTTFDWATATDEEVEVKFGILNAWFMPGGEDLGLYPSMTSINTFPTLFTNYYGLDYPLLPDRVYAAKRYDLQYDVIDVTDRLPSLR